MNLTYTPADKISMDFIKSKFNLNSRAAAVRYALNYTATKAINDNIRL